MEPDDGARAEGEDAVSRAMLWIASLALAAMMLVVVADVVLRFAFNTPVRGAYDVVSIGLLVMVFFGIAPVLIRRSEILIDLIDPLLPKVALRVLGIVAAIGTIVVFVFLGWSMTGPAFDAYRYGDRSLELGVPVWILWVVAFVGLVGILWAAVRRLARELRGGEAPPPGSSEEGGL